MLFRKSPVGRTLNRKLFTLFLVSLVNSETTKRLAPNKKQKKYINNVKTGIFFALMLSKIMMLNLGIINHLNFQQCMTYNQNIQMVLHW